MSDAIHSSDDHGKCSVSNTEPSQSATDAVACRRNRSSVQFVVPIKHKTVNGRNERLMSDECSAHVNVARPVVMTLSHTQDLSDKCLYTSSILKLPDLKCINTFDKNNADDLSHSTVEGENFVVKSSEANQSEVQESVVIDTANDCIVKNDGSETLLTVSASDQLLQQQLARPDVATVSNDATVISHSSDAGEYLNLSHLSEKAVDSLAQPSELSFADDIVRTHRLTCEDSQLKQTANKTKEHNLKASPGSLLMSRNTGNGSRLSMKDAVGGCRPHSHSLLEVTFKITNSIMCSARV